MVPKEVADQTRATFPVHTQGAPVVNPNAFANGFPRSQVPVPILTHGRNLPLASPSSSTTLSHPPAPTPNQTAAAHGLLVLFQQTATPVPHITLPMGLGPVHSHHPPSSIRPHQLPLPSGPVGLPPPGAPLLATRSPVPTYQQFRRYIIYNDPENTTSSPSDCLDSDDLMRNMRKNLETLLEKKEYMKTVAANIPDYEKIMKEMNSVIDKQYDEIWNRLFQRHNL